MLRELGSGILHLVWFGLFFLNKTSYPGLLGFVRVPFLNDYLLSHCDLKLLRNWANEPEVRVIIFHINQSCQLSLKLSL